MPSSTAQVATDRPERYLKQLADHLGRRGNSERADDGSTGTVRFDFGVVELRTEPGTLVMSATADDDEALRRVEDVAGRHLVRFGERDGLTVSWA